MNSEVLGVAFREHNAPALATLIRLLGDFDLAEDALQEAWISAGRAWAEARPDNPTAWLITTARRRALDRIRRDASGARKLAEVARSMPNFETDPFDSGPEPQAIADDRLRLIFTCCHPALTVEARIALTLRTLGGLTTAEIAHAFLVEEPTIAQRIVRAKRKIRDANIPYRVPESHELPGRLPGVLAVLYLVFNEGYASTSDEALVRRDLCVEAIRLARLLCLLMPDELEAAGLLALMLLQDSRRHARQDSSGEIVLLDDQDRSLWDRAEIEEGVAVLDRALRGRRAGPYQVQAAIAAVHAESRTAAETRWEEVAALYDRLVEILPTPVVHLNRAVAVAMAYGSERGLALMEPLADGLRDYHLFHSARADLLRRLGRSADARAAYTRALELVTNPAERRFLERRIAEMSAPSAVE